MIATISLQTSSFLKTLAITSPASLFKTCTPTPDISCSPKTSYAPIDTHDVFIQAVHRACRDSDDLGLCPEQYRSSYGLTRQCNHSDRQPNRCSLHCHFSQQQHDSHSRICCCVKPSQRHRCQLPNQFVWLSITRRTVSYVGPSATLPVKVKRARLLTALQSTTSTMTQSQQMATAPPPAAISTPSSAAKHPFATLSYPIRVKWEISQENMAAFLAPPSPQGTLSHFFPS